MLQKNKNKKTDHARRTARGGTDGARSQDAAATREISVPITIVTPVDGHAEVTGSPRAVSAPRVKGKVERQGGNNSRGLNVGSPRCSHRCAPPSTGHVVSSLRVQVHGRLDLARSNCGDDSRRQMCIQLACVIRRPSPALSSACAHSTMNLRT